MIISLKQVKYVGPKIYHHFIKQNLWSTYDLVLSRPKRYENYVISNLEEVLNQEVVTITGKVIGHIQSFKKKVHVTKFYIEVEKTKIEVTAFNQPYLEKSLKEEQSILIKGQYNIYTRKMVAQKISTNTKIPNLKPVYQYEGISDTQVFKIISEIFKEDKVTLYETLPKELLNKYHLLNRNEAYKKLHHPKDQEELKQVLRRLKYEEAFLQQKKWVKSLKERPYKQPLSYNLTYVKQQITKIPYTLTKDQKRVVNEIFTDFKKPYHTERLIQGDVGSGKTVVAFLAAIGAISAGKQAILMAPTEILAKQHYDNFKKLYPEIKSSLLTSKVKNKTKILEEIATTESMFIIGTHALASDKTVFNDLGLIIIDEQHKFGVKIKDDLLFKNQLADIIYLTATPIPRTLAIAYFKDLEVSSIKEKPANRKQIHTSIKEIEDVIDLLKHQQNIDQQCYIVVPAIDAVTKTYNIENVLDKLKQHQIQHLYVIHGKQSNEKQEQMMKEFSQNPKGILLATSVIEVGIDLKTASAIFILGANYFGLSQLHQLRGRVGRGEIQSFCYLVSEDKDNERLNILTKENDGFKLSEFDLKTRGPGEFLGEKQSGFIKYQYLDLSTDLNILLQARKDVENYI